MNIKFLRAKQIHFIELKGIINENRVIDHSIKYQTLKAIYFLISSLARYYCESKSN